MKSSGRELLGELPVADVRGKFPAHRRYRPTAVGGIKELPVHWGEKPLKHLSAINSEKLPDSTDPDYEMEYVDIGNVSLVEGITSTERLAFENAPSRARRRVRRGDTIVSTVRTYLKAVARIQIPAENLVVSTGFAVLRPGEELDGGYLYRVAQSEAFVQRVVAHSVGVSYPAINPSDLGAFKIPLPPRPEQQAIAAFLDRETAKIDSLVEKKRRLIELLKEKRAALISHAVTKGLNPGVPIKESGIEWLGQVPEHWEVVRPMYLTEFGHSIMYGIVLPGPHVEGGVPIVKGGDVSPDRLRRDLLRCTTPEIEAGYQRSRLRAGDIVYAIRGSIGAAELVPDECAGANITQDTAKIAPGPSVERRWFLYTMKSGAVFAQLERGAVGATIRGINIRDLKRCKLPVPPGGEQADIAEYLDVETAKLDNLMGQVTLAIDRLLEYRTALISAAVTGKIDVRGEV